MKAVRIHSYGGSEQISIEDAPKPELQDGQVLVRVHDAGVNPVDWKIREGFMKEVAPAEFPLTLGQDCAGIVEEVGKGVRNFKSGDEVFGFAHGAYAELATATENSIARKPKNIDFAAAASIPTAGLTAWQLVCDVVNAQPGQTILIQGAAGGVGSFAVQLAKWRGAQVIATAAGDDFPYLRDIGVDILIDYRSQRFEELVVSVDAAIDLVGGAVLGRTHTVLKRNGGIIVSTVGAPDANYLKRINARGVRFMMKQNSTELAQLAGLIEQGIVKPRLAEVLPLDDAKIAQERLQTGHSHGKIVLAIQ